MFGQVDPIDNPCQSAQNHIDLFRAIVISPDVGHTKYMTAAQLFPGTQSRDLYLKVRHFYLNTC